MKKPIKTLSAVISLFVLCSSVAGCNRGGDEVKINHDMSQLYVGFGFSDDSFLPQLAKEFEEAYKDVEFEPGKKGVQVFINSNGKFSETGTIYSNLSSYQEEIVIAEQLELNRLVKQNLVAEITDAVKTPISSNAYSEKVDLGETQSIEDKMADTYKDYYGKDGKYYAVPYTESTIGIIYDVDLFDKEGLYFARAGKGNSDGFVEEGYTADDLSAGPDGEYGTYDDGLPATYDDFFKLCKYMQLEFAITPVIWGGKVQTYPVTFMTSLYADYEGEQQMRLNYDFNGTANDLVCVENGKVQYNADGTLKTYSTAISASNGYELYKQSGRYYALSFLERLVNSEYYNSSDCFGGTVDHLTAQGKFLLSKAKNEPTAMLIDGTWWQSEARKSNVFSDMAEKYGSQYALENRNFAFMPLPKATSDKVGEKQTTMMFIDSMAFVNGNVKAEKTAFCELFLKYMHTRQSLLQYIQVTGQMKPFEIELTKEEYNGLTGFGKSSYNIHKYTNLLLPLSYNDVFCTAKYLFSPNGMQVWQSANGEIVTSMIKNDGITAEQHFFDIINYRSAENGTNISRECAIEMLRKGRMKNKNGEGRLSEWISSLRWTLYELFRKIGAPHGNKPKKLKNKKKKGALFCTAMLAFPLLQFFLFYICVNFTSVLLAFQKLDVNGNAVWVGLENFKTLFSQFQTEKVFTYALKNSLLSYLIGTICTTPLTLIFSFYIYKKMFGHNLMKIMLFLPSVISSIVMVMIYMYFVDLAVPVVFETVFHIEIQGLYSNAEIRFRTILFYNIWFGLGGGILMYIYPVVCNIFLIMFFFTRWDIWSKVRVKNSNDYYLYRSNY